MPFTSLIRRSSPAVLGKKGPPRWLLQQHGVRPPIFYKRPLSKVPSVVLRAKAARKKRLQQMIRYWGK